MRSKSNMLTGSPFKALLLFALPMVLGNLFQSLYNIVDSIIVGKFVGQSALAATGSTSTIINVYIAIALGLGTGCMIIFSQLFGARIYARMRTAMNTCMIFLGLLSIVAVAVGLGTMGLLLPTIVNDAIYDEAQTYYFIYVLSFPALFVYNAASAVFNSLGKSKYILYLLGGSSILNVVLDLWFVLGFKWGVAGAAIATDISQYLVAVIGVVWALSHLKKNYRTEDKVAAFDGKLLVNMLKVAVPSMLAQVVVSVGYMVLMGFVNNYSVDVISGYVAAFKLDSLCSIPMVQVGNAMATFAGQNVGAKQYDRVPKGIKSGAIMCAVIWVVFAAVVWLFGHGLIGLFMDSSASEAAYTAGIQYMKIMSSLYILLGLMYIYAATLRGTGDYLVSVIAVTCNFGGRCIFAWIFAGLINGYIPGSELWIWWSNPLGWAIAIVICFLRFRTGIWRTKRLADKV